ncbi:VIT1/CCC1 transporter family protein [Candidatus Woesearchaeota archaeon]|nr:VIT1/CCC1 transporter family protein [Candidatus Woesearchaeota archaeon]
MKKKQSSKSHSASYIFKDIILGGQDGLVNVLALVLGIGAATSSTKIVIISGLAALFAESISMGAVAYTSSKSAYDYYKSMVRKEKQEIKQVPHLEKKEIEDIYRKKGFKGRLLSQIVSKITSNKKVWIDTMMAEELRLFPQEYFHPLKNGLVVGFASVGGSLIPLFPFFFLSVKTGIYTAFFVSIFILFLTGIVKARLTKQKWFKCGLELALIGTAAAVAGYLIGFGLDKLL